jgi:hypothetical protein
MQQPASNSHSSGAKYAVKASDMSDEMQKDAIDMAIEVRLLVSMRSRSSAGPNWWLVYAEYKQVGHRAGYCRESEEGL